MRCRIGRDRRAAGHAFSPRRLPMAGATAGAPPPSTTAGRRSRSKARTPRSRSCKGRPPTLRPARPPPPSCSRAFAALLARTEAGFQLHVEAPWLETLLTWLDGV